MKFSIPKRPKKGASELKVYPCKRRFSVYSMPKLPTKEKDKHRYRIDSRILTRGADACPRPKPSLYIFYGIKGGGGRRAWVNFDGLPPALRVEMITTTV